MANASKIENRLHESGCRAIGPELSTVGREVILLNPCDRGWTRHRFVLTFGVYARTRLMVWANDLNSALEECVDWIVEHAPGLLCDEHVQEAYEEAIASGMSEEEAYDDATVDVTVFGHSGVHYLSEWAIALEDPTRAQLREYLGAP